ADRPSRAVQHALDRAARREQEQLGLASVLALRDQARKWRGAQLARALRRRDLQSRGAVVQLRCVPGGDGAAGLEGGRELRQRVEARLARRLVLRDRCDDALPPGNVDRHDLVVERAAPLRGERFLVAAHGEAILILARERAALRGLLSSETHVPTAVRVDESVDEIRVLDHVLAERQTAAQTTREVWRVRHRLHATRDDAARFSGEDLRRREHDALEARAAHLVDGGTGNALRQPGTEGGL